VPVRAIDVVDIAVYLVVLGLFIQFFPQVISETFVLALLTAILLKVVLEIVLAAKKWVVGRLRSASSVAGRVTAGATLLLVLPGSKFLVLELTAVVFGGAVELGGFFVVTALIVTLMLARGAVRFLLERGGRAD
jgi:hypothetical protein